MVCVAPVSRRVVAGITAIMVVAAAAPFAVVFLRGLQNAGAGSYGAVSVGTAANACKLGRRRHGSGKPPSAFDLHALRHTFGTHLSKTGVVSRTAQAAVPALRAAPAVAVREGPRVCGRRTGRWMGISSQMRTSLRCCEPGSGRWRAFLMEIDALYCDVIVQRWEQCTGQRAERIAAAEEATYAKG